MREQGDRRFYVWVGVSGLLWIVTAKVPLVPWVLREKCELVRAEIGCSDWLMELCSLVGADFRSLYTVPCVPSRVVYGQCSG